MNSRYVSSTGGRETHMTEAVNLLPGVPRFEQPFFADHFPAATTAPQLLQVARDLHEKGYAVLPFPDAEFATVAARIIGSLREQFDLSGWRNGGGGMRVQDAWQTNADVRRLAVNEQLLQLLGAVYGRPAFPFQTLNFPVGTEQHVHTDSVHFSSMPERWMCGVWVALEDIHPDAGPLVYYPGSHRWPVFVNEHVGHVHRGSTTQAVFEPLWRRLIEAHGTAPDRLVVPAGTALIWAANLLHGGDAHRDRSRTRWSQVTHYYFEDCAYYTPMESDPALGSIRFREPLDIRTGVPVANSYRGEKTDRSFIDTVNPDARAQRLKEQARPRGLLGGLRSRLSGIRR
jgi:hypothetical protein